MSDVMHGNHAVHEDVALTDGQKRFQAQTLALAIFFTIAVSASAGIILLVLRLPAGESIVSITPLHVARAFGVTLAFILSVALAIERRLPAWAVALLPIGLLALIVRAGAFLPVSGDIFLALAIVTFLTAAYRRRLLFATGLPAILVLGLVIAAVTMAALVLRGYAHPLAFENALLGIQNKDTLFHAAIAGSQQHLNVTSIGLDGAVSLSYHTLSHRLIGTFATWSHLPDLMGYSLFVPVVAVPVLLFLMLCSPALTANSLDLRTDALVGTCTLVALTLLLNAATLMSMWLSESFVIGLWALLLAMIAMKQRGGRRADILTAASLAILVLFASLAKISIGAILASGICIWLALSGGIWGVLMAAVFGAAPFLLVYFTSFAEASGEGGSMFGPLYFYGHFPGTFVAMGITGYAIYRLHRADRTRDRDAIIFRLAAAGMLASAFFCGLVLRLPGAAETYFASPGLWAALFYIGTEGVLTRWSPMSTRIPRSTAAISVAGISVLAAALALTAAKPPRVAKAYRNSIEKLRAVAGDEGTQGLLAKTAFGRIVAQIETDPAIDAVQVDPQVREIWEGSKPCWAASLIIPATTRRPMLAGLPPAAEKCELTPYYGFASYRNEISAARTFDETALCQKGEALSLDTILRVSPTGMTTLNCKTRTQ